MQHAIYAALWAYNPETGQLTTKRNNAPVTALWYAKKAANPKSVSLRARVRSEEHGTIEDKAERVAYVLHTGRDLPANTEVKHLNGDKRDNRASNLYVSDTASCTDWLPNTPTARLIAQAAGVTPIAQGPMIGLTGLYRGRPIVESLLHEHREYRCNTTPVPEGKSGLEAHMALWNSLEHDETLFAQWLAHKAQQTQRHNEALKPILQAWETEKKTFTKADWIL